MTGYPWNQGDALIAADLNAAIAGATVPVGGSIQGAIDALPTTGGIINLSANTTYLLTGTLTITKPNVTLSAPGCGTIIRRTVGMTGHLIDAQVTATGFTIQNITVDGNGPTNTAGNFEVAVNGADSLVRHCQIINAGAQGHLALSGAGSRAEGNTIKGLGTVQGNYGIWAIGGVKTFVINNYITDCGIDGIGFNGAGTQIIGNHIAGCQCYATPTTIGGGQIVQYNTPAQPGAIIEGNFIGAGGGSDSSGIELNGVNVSVIGNVIINQACAGIFIDGGTGDGVLISGNSVLNCGQNAVASWKCGMVAFGPLKNLMVVGNRFAATVAPIQYFGLYLSGSFDNLVITNNDITGNTQNLAPSDTIAGTGHVISNNLGIASIPGTPTVNAANDAAAASAGVVVGGEYRNGSIKMVRVA